MLLLIPNSWAQQNSRYYNSQPINSVEDFELMMQIRAANLAADQFNRNRSDQYNSPYNTGARYTDAILSRFPKYTNPVYNNVILNNVIQKLKY